MQHILSLVPSRFISVLSAPRRSFAHREQGFFSFRHSNRREVRGAVRRLGLPVVRNPCPANGTTKREETKELLLQLEKQLKTPPHSPLAPAEDLPDRQSRERDS